jgi:hypothetical protein
MPMRNDDDHLVQVPFKNAQNGYIVYLPSDAELLHPDNYIALWFATLQFRAWYEREVLKKRAMSRNDWPTALSILLSHHIRRNGGFRIAATDEEAVLDEIDDVLESLRAISEYMRVDPKTGGPYVYSIDVRRLRLFYAILGSFYISHFPKGTGGP